MLVLTRNVGEKICIGGRMVVVTLVQIRGDRARIGIDCDKGITVNREEIEVIHEAALTDTEDKAMTL
jgi:carbon storage regulator CsrA